MDKIISFDYSLTNFFSKLVPDNIFFDYFFSFFSLKGGSILIWLLVIFIIIILEERKSPGISKRDKKFIILFSVSFLLTFFLSDIVLKNIFQRDRPFDFASTSLSAGAQGKPLITDYRLPIQLITACPTDFSFPSAHAATAFAAATALTFFDKKRRWFYYVVAILIAYSRIYLGCHYFFDVVSGAIFGWSISRLLLFVPYTSPFRRRS